MTPPPACGRRCHAKIKPVDESRGFCIERINRMHFDRAKFEKGEKQGEKKKDELRLIYRQSLHESGGRRSGGWLMKQGDEE